MGLPTKEQIKKSAKLVLEKVQTPEWADDGPPEECFVFVKRMRPRERDAWEISVSKKGDGLPKEVAATARMDNFTASLCAATICDEAGKLLFSAAEVDDLGQVDAVALKRCYRAATKLNGMDEKELEELEKNSEAAPDTSSPTS